MEEEERNNGSETVPVSSPVKRKTHVERRVNFTDTLIREYSFCIVINLKQNQ